VRKVTDYRLRDDEELINFQTEGNLQPYYDAVGNSLLSCSRIRHLHVRFVRLQLRLDDIKRVLLIEDDLDLYQLLKYNLERSGF